MFLHSVSGHQDKDALLRMLMEAEVNGAAAAKQASALRESIFNLCAPGSNVSLTSGSALSMCPVRLGEHGNFRKKQEAFSVFHDAVFLSLSVSLLMKKPFGSESSALACQNELLLQKLETFEVTNRTLRKLLREQHESQVLCKMQRAVLQSESNTLKSEFRVTRRVLV